MEILLLQEINYYCKYKLDLIGVLSMHKSSTTKVPTTTIIGKKGMRRASIKKSYIPF